MGCAGQKSGDDSTSGDKKVYVNDNCIGCGACVAICDWVFDLNDEWKAFVKEWACAECTDDAIWACPVDAIHYED